MHGAHGLGSGAGGSGGGSLSAACSTPPHLAQPSATSHRLSSLPPCKLIPARFLPHACRTAPGLQPTAIPPASARSRQPGAQQHRSARPHSSVSVGCSTLTAAQRARQLTQQHRISSTAAA